MTEELWSIDTPDGKKIHGVINRSNKGGNDKVIIHAHGVTGSVYEPSQYVMANSFPDNHGYDVIRVELYSWRENARALHECTVKIHGQDLTTVARHFQEEYKKVFGAGHSYGGPSLLMTEQESFTAFSLWEPTYPLEIVWLNSKLEPYGDNYIDAEGSIHSVIGKAMVEEGLFYTVEQCNRLSEEIKIPIQVILGEKGSLIKKGVSYHSFCKTMTEYKTVESAGHTFWEENSVEPLLNHTRKWFDKF